MSVFVTWAKILPFFILKKLNDKVAPRGPVKLHLMNIYYNHDWDEEREHKIVDVDICQYFPGIYVLSDERFNLEKREKELETKLKCVKKKLGEK
jgi:hypothetical protein